MNVNNNIKGLLEKFDKDRREELKKFLMQGKEFDDIRLKIALFWKLTWAGLIVLPLITVSLFLFKVKILYIILFFIIFVPCFLFLIIANLIRLYIIWGKVADWFVLNLNFNKAIVRANFFLDNKRIVRKYFIYSGREIEYQKGLYMIDEKAIHIDSDNIPNVYYRFGCPNPIIFNLTKEFEVYKKAVEDTPKGFIISAKGLIGQFLDLSYSSENLRLFKDDKIFSELHKADKIDGMQLLIIGLIVVAIILIVVVLMGKGGNSQATAPVTQAIIGGFLLWKKKNQ